jgi:hypothetical protein
MSWKTLRTQVGDVLRTLTKIQEVSDTPKLSFDGYPAACVIPSESESDYETTSENERVYAFLVRIFYTTKDTTVAIAMGALEECLDDVIDAFDQQDKKTTGRILGISLPAKYTYLAISATPSVVGELPDQQLLMGEVKVKIRVSYDAT